MKSGVGLIGLVVGMALSAGSSSAQDEKMNVKEWTAASQLLTEAAGLIKEHGWQQGATDPVAQECIATALEKAFRQNPSYTLVDLNYARAVLNTKIGAQGFPETGAVDFKASDKPAVPYWGVEYMDWNDASGRTEDAVLNVLFDAAQTAAELAKDASAR